MPSYVARRFVLEGQVQRVGCRARIYEAVENLGHISGYVRNLPNGSVEVLVKGPEWRVNDLEKYLRSKMQEPVRVDRLLVEDASEIQIPNGFAVKRD